MPVEVEIYLVWAYLAFKIGIFQVLYFSNFSHNKNCVLRHEIWAVMEGDNKMFPFHKEKKYRSNGIASFSKHFFKTKIESHEKLLLLAEEI